MPQISASPNEERFSSKEEFAIDDFDPSIFEVPDTEVDDQEQSNLPTGVTLEELAGDEDDSPLDEGALLSLDAPQWLDEDEEREEAPSASYGLNLEPAALGDDDDEHDSAIDFSGIALLEAGAEEDDEPLTDTTFFDLIDEALPKESLLELAWLSDQACSGLLEWGECVLAIGAECRLHDASGNVTDSWPAPEGLTSAAVLPVPSPAILQATGLEPSWFAASCYGKLHECIGKTWLPARLRARVCQVLTMDGGVYAQDQRLRWYQLESGAFRPTFEGRRLATVASAGRWLGLLAEDQQATLLSWPPDVTVRFAGALAANTRIYGRDKVFVLTDSRQSVWVSSDQGRCFRRVSGLSADGPGCFGVVGKLLRYWTCQESAHGLDVVEVDPTTATASVIAALPWRTTDDDAPLVTQLLFHESSAQLLIASDRGIASLTRHPEQ